MPIATSSNQVLHERLRQRPIREVFVCGQKFHPPLFSHVVTFPRLEIPLKGAYENQIVRDGEVTTVCLRPGAVLFAAPNCWNLPTWRLHVELMSLLFGKKHIGISHVIGRGMGRPQMAAQKFSIPFPVTGPVPGILEALVELQVVGRPQEAFGDLARALVRCVCELIQHPVEPPLNRAQSLLESICVYLQSHYQYDITRDFVARQFAITPNHLSRLFQTHGNMTFTSYLTHVRVNRSKHLLSNYDLKLDAIAARCGFRDTPYFCRVFKRLAKATPAEYRLAHGARPGDSD
jgi:AraC-like DNA-binding protein